MKITNKTLKNANVTIVANKLYTSFISPTFFEFLPNPTNIVQIPPFGLMDFGTCSLIVDVDNRRVVINHISGNIAESPVPKMAEKFLANVKGPEVVAVGLNYIIDITCDEEFWKYSVSEFLAEKYKKILGTELAAVGFKAFIKKGPYTVTMTLDPNIAEPLHAILNANFNYEIPDMITFENDFKGRYNEIEGYINGIFV